MIDVQTRLDIEALIHRHAWLIDHGEAEKIVELYTDDGQLYGIGPDKIGRAAIEEWARQRSAMSERRSRHVHSNIVLEQIETEVRGSVVLTLYRHDGPGEGSPTPLLVGEYADLYRKSQDGTWRFAERNLTVLFGRA